MLRRRLESWLKSIWYQGRPVPWPLALLERVYVDLTALRRWLYAHGLRRSVDLPVPVIVVGNISVGGTGKTPLVAWLACELAAHGWQPGIVSRGYGARVSGVRRVLPEDDAASVGDEALLLARSTHLPVAISRRRVAAGRVLCEDAGCDVLLTDDGLQHWSLARDLEIAVVDGVRRYGNGRLLPAGPLREPVARLERVDFIVVNGGVASAGEIAMQVSGRRAVSLIDASVQRELRSWAGQKVHAVAGIGQPERFFAMLESHGLVVDRHPLPDHHQFSGDEIGFADDAPVLVTEKDAVKCARYADARCYAVPVDAELPAGFADEVHRRLCALRDARPRAEG